VPITYGYQPRRLATPLLADPPSLPSWADLGLDSVALEAREWFRLRDSVAFLEVASLWYPHQTDRWTELAGLAGSIGEVVSVACAAEVEAVLLERGIASGALQEPLGMGRRAFGESEGSFVMSAAHKLTNWCARAAMLSPDYPWGWGGSPNCLRQRFSVFSENIEQWLMAKKGTAVADILSRARDPGLAQVADALTVFLDSSEWKELSSQRGEDFHRWRYESPYVTAIAKASRWIDDPTRRTRTLPIGTAPEYTVATAIVDDVCRMSHAAAMTLSKALTGVRLGFAKGVPFLSGGAAALDSRPDGSTATIPNLFR
jgi:hypothetical protein